MNYAERYANGEINHAGFMGSYRTQHTATLLTDGRVFLLGGYIELGVAFAAQPEATSGFNAWEFLPPPQNARLLGHTATRLLDGRVLVVGGRTQWGEIESKSVEIFDPLTNTWQTAPSMNYARCWHTATLLPDGRVLVDGGAYDGVNPAEIFTP